MGYYVELPVSKGKLGALLALPEAKARVITSDEAADLVFDYELEREDDSEGVVCVIENYLTFDAIGFAFDVRELERFVNIRDRKWTLVAVNLLMRS